MTSSRSWNRKVAHRVILSLQDEGEHRGGSGYMTHMIYSTEISWLQCWGDDGRRHRSSKRLDTILSPEHVTSEESSLLTQHCAEFIYSLKIQMIQTVFHDLSIPFTWQQRQDMFWSIVVECILPAVLTAVSVKPLRPLVALKNKWALLRCLIINDQSYRLNVDLMYYYHHVRHFPRRDRAMKHQFRRASSFVLGWVMWHFLQMSDAVRWTKVFRLEGFQVLIGCDNVEHWKR